VQRSHIRQIPLAQDANQHWLSLFYGPVRRPLAVIVPDPVYRGMYRVLWSDGRKSDIVNFARAKDAAMAFAERGPPRRDTRELHWRKSRESQLEGRTGDSKPAPVSHDHPSPADLVATTGLSPQQVELGTALMRTARADLIEAVIAGRMGIHQALAAAREQRC
jgi:hypothetical protein